MNVLVDTSVWSLALRRRAGDLNSQQTVIVEELRNLIQEGKVKLLGVVRQELLSGIKTTQQFEKLREFLSAFPDEEIVPTDYIEAAKLGNTCRAKGVAVSLVDMLICGVAVDRGWDVFTIDPDFERYSKILGIRLHRLRE